METNEEFVGATTEDLERRAKTVPGLKSICRSSGSVVGAIH